MTTLAELVESFASDERPAGNLLSEESLVAQAIAATRFYAGYAALQSQETPNPSDITPTTDVSTSEWALIRPLFLLYIERENALQLEASRGLGVDPFGRSASEVAGDIAATEAEMPHRAFSQLVITV